MRTRVPAKAALRDGGCLSTSSDKLDRGLVQPGGELSAGVWVEGPWAERGAGLHGTVEHHQGPWPHQAGGAFLCSPPGGCTGPQA